MRWRRRHSENEVGRHVFRRGSLGAESRLHVGKVGDDTWCVREREREREAIRIHPRRTLKDFLLPPFYSRLHDD